MKKQSTHRVHKSRSHSPRSGKQQAVSRQLFSQWRQINPLIIIVSIVLMVIALFSWIFTRQTSISDIPLIRPSQSAASNSAQFVVGTYQTTVTLPNNKSQFISLDLADNQTATLSQELPGTKTVTTERGRWEITDQRLVLELTQDSEGVLPVTKTVEFEIQDEVLRLTSPEQINQATMPIDLKKKSVLSQTEWKWEKTVLKKAAVVLPDNKLSFGIKFDEAGTVIITTDCNSGRASYSVTADSLEFGTISKTKMFCKDSVEADFFSQLKRVKTYQIAQPQLLLFLADDAGVMVFGSAARTSE